MGTLFVSRLTDLLAGADPGAAGGGASANSLTPDLVRSLPDAPRDVIVNAYNDALTPVFLLMVPLMLIAVVLLAFIQEKPLAISIERDVPAGSLATDGARDDLSVDRSL